MSSDNRKRKRPKSYYIKSAKQARNSKPGSSTWQVLTAGMKGFLLTCNFREKECVREAYNLLNEYADKMYGPEEAFLRDKKPADDASDDEEEEDLEAALKKEVQIMKDKKSTDRRFQVVDSGAKNCIFIKTTLDNPGKVMEKIMNDVYDTKECKVRHIQRMLPITRTCKAYIDDLKTIIPPFLQPYLDEFPGARPSFCVMFKVRNNNKVGRHEVYEVVGEIMEECEVNTVNPDIVIIVEVIKSVCCLGVVKDYFKFRKFNMHEIVERTGEKAAEKGTESEEKSAEKGTESEEKSAEKGTSEEKSMEKGTDSEEKSAEKGTESEEKSAEKGTEIEEKSAEKGTESEEKSAEKGTSEEKSAEKGT